MSDEPWAKRRKRLKAGILYDLSVTVGEAWQMWFEQADDLRISDEALATLLEEVGTELRQRSDRLKATR